MKTLVILLLSLFLSTPGNETEKCNKVVKKWVKKNWKYNPEENCYETSTINIWFGEGFPYCICKINKEDFVSIFGEPSKEKGDTLIYYLAKNGKLYIEVERKYIDSYLRFIFGKEDKIVGIGPGDFEFTYCK